MNKYKNKLNSMATTARRSIVGQTGNQKVASQLDKDPQEDELKSIEADQDEEEFSSEQARLQKRIVQMQYIEQEN